jgi:hypothetical protein
MAFARYARSASADFASRLTESGLATVRAARLQGMRLLAGAQRAIDIAVGARKKPDLARAGSG